MSAAVDRDPDRVPGAPPGYRPITAGLGSCNRCGAAININDPIATSKHAEFHQGLRAMWATAQSKSPPTPSQEASSVAGRGGVEGANHDDSRPGTDGRAAPTAPGATPPPGAADDPPPSRRPPGGPNRSRRGG